ncbi:MAG: cyclodeaminase/cyclohydrolase family protein [Acidobacteriota bacterium]|nr:cyclodeaminase/cyclohydrolase family protein [Acidobacteriota bacterium]
MSFSSRSVEDFLSALASPEPTPGGGTASAIVGAMGVALLVMVAGLTKTRANTDDERSTLVAVRASLEPLGRSLQACADRDADAFNQVMAGFRLPKATEDEKARRKAAIQAALKAATDVPLETLRLVTTAAEFGETVARHGNSSATSDVRVAAGLLGAAADGAAANVRTNLDGLADHDYRMGAAMETDQLLSRSEEARARLLAALD